MPTAVTRVIRHSYPTGLANTMPFKNLRSAATVVWHHSKHTSQVDRLVCIKHHRLNEIDSGKLRKFQSWINALRRGFWVCNSSNNLLKLSDELTTLASSLPNIVVEVVSAVTMPSERCMIVGHSKWYPFVFQTFSFLTIDQFSGGVL
jgi:hypothetical protein